MRPHVFTNLGPNGKQDALPLVLAGSVLVRKPEIARDYWAVYCSDYLTQGYFPRRPREHVTASYTSFGSHKPRPFQSQENLLEVWLR